MLTVLETVARQGPVSASDVARLCDINRTVAHRLLVTLSQRAYVRRSEGGYTIGPAVFNLARQTKPDLRDVAKPTMEKLAAAIGETVVLHGLDNWEAVVIDQAVGQQHLVRVEHRPGSRHPLYKGASGWSILAFQSEKAVARILKKADDPADALARIELTKVDGYSISHDELQMGVHGIAAPLVDSSGHCEASVGVLVPSIRAALLPSLTKPLLNAAAEISKNLG
ncbi:MAG: transcriptional regulator [Mesorhizobium sp. 65-26]|nr:IclR family transcriptional regulator [Mesorhizobium sp.]ODT30185.1 MAG: transcriptional regulator [Hyphomicrobium sp. SCN 65-11]OJX71219.1 MAG: transcriptional regulator [Mesorhizobium sp. 65-26]